MNKKPRPERLKMLRRLILDSEIFSTWNRPSETYGINTYIGQTGISEITARRDLDRMVAEGFLERRIAGKGWFVYYEYREIPLDGRKVKMTVSFIGVLKYESGKWKVQFDNGESSIRMDFVPERFEFVQEKDS